MKNFMVKIIVGAALAVTPAVAFGQTFDANPTVAFTYGSGNNYLPANAVVLTGTESELALRAHVTGQPAISTGGTGIYTFALGTTNVSIDYSFSGTAAEGATVNIINLLTGDDASFDAALFGSFNTSGAVQGSQRLSFGFLNGGILGPNNDINFNANENNTFQINLLGGGQTLTGFAQIGTGAGVGAVPEPGTWAMLLMGFGGMGVALRRRRRTSTLLQAA